MLKFEPKTHRYTWNGQPVLSVTQIIEAWMELNYFGEKIYVNRYSGRWMTVNQMDTARARGIGIHNGFAVVLEHGDCQCADVVRHPMEEFKRWIDTHLPDKSLIYLVEEKMFSPRHYYAGTPDIVCWKDHKKRILRVIDVKMADDSLAGPQTAAYEHLVKVNMPKGSRLPKVERFSLILPCRGKGKTVPRFRFIHKKDPKDFAKFKAMLYLSATL